MQNKHLWFFLIFLVISVCQTPSVFASDEITLDIFRPMANISIQRVPEKTFENIEGHYASRSLAFNATLPIGKTTLDASGSILSQYFVTTQFQYWNPEISLFSDEQQRFYKGSLNFATLLAVDLDHFFIFSGGVSLAEDEQTITDPELRPALLGVGVYRPSPSLSLVYGLAYSYMFGTGYCIPIAGLNWKLSPHVSLSTLLPVFVKLTHHINDVFKMGYRIGVAGDRTRFANQDFFPDQPDTLYLSDVYGVVSVDAVMRLSDHVFLFGDLGYMGGRKLIFSDQNTRFQENTIEYAPFFKLGIRLFWGSGKQMDL